MLSDQPTLEPLDNPLQGYFFHSARGIEKKLVYGKGKNPERASDADRTCIRDAKNEGFSDMQTYLQQAAESGHEAFWQEHLFYMIDSSVRYKRTFGVENAPDAALDDEGTSKTNPTFFSDAFMLSIRPIFLIRHPVISFPSCLRVWKAVLKGSIDEKANAEVLTFCWTRLMYQWYIERAEIHTAAPTPILIDADDFIGSRTLQEAVCQRLGFDVSKIKRTWSQATEDEVEKLGPIAAVCSTLYYSAGIVENGASISPKLDEAMKTWEDEFGAKEAEKLASFVKGAMPDYTWLRERCMTASSLHSYATNA